MNENLGWIGKIYPDECAYSIASRLAVATLGCSQYRTNCILFGSARNLEVYVHQPLKRKNLEQWGMDASRSGYEKHVQEHSIYPLYSTV